MPYWYAIYLWSLFFNPSYPPQPAYQLEHQRQQMQPLAPVIYVPTQGNIQPGTTHVLSVGSPVYASPQSPFPPGYVPNPTQMGLTYIPNPTEMGLR